jgi:PAS domain S-box-containing protein
MGQITQRQTALALISIIFISLLLVIISTWLPESGLPVQRSRLFLYLAITAVLWLLIWYDWRYARHLTVSLITVMTAVAIPQASLTQTVSQGALLPPILAMALTGIPGVIGSALATWLILLWRSGAEGMYASPPSIVIYSLAVSGLVLGKLVVDARLATERDLLQALMDNIPDHIYFKDTASRFIRINQTQAGHLGLSQAEEAIGKTDFDFQPASLSQTFLAEEQEMMRTGRPIMDRIEYNPTPDGRDRWLSASKAPIYGKNGRITGMVGISRDVSERIRIEESLRHSERNYREIFNATSDAIFIHDAQTGAILDVNSRALEMYGYSYDQILQLTISDLSANEPPYTQAEANITIANAVAVGPQLFEWRGRRQNGELFWVEVALRSSEISGHGRVLAVVRDITGRKQSEEDLRLSEERLDKIFRASADAISLSTLADGRVIDINNAHTRIFGFTRKEIIGQTVFTLNVYVDPADRAKMRAILEERGEVHNLELKVRRKSGEIFDGLFSAEVINIRGELCIVGTMRDITEQKQAAAALQSYARELERSNRELNNFAYVASHDLQEPLRKIQTFSNRLLESYQDGLDERGQDYIRRMDNAAARMQSLIHDLLVYARTGANGTDMTSIFLTQVVQEVLADLEDRLVETGGQVIVGDLPSIEADPIQMRQLFQNLIGNGLKFHRPDIPPIVRIDGRIPSTSAPVPSLELTVTDNGIGFDEKYLPRLFTMFQRLHGREQYEGTGVGLAICRRIVEQHHGTITAHSQPGEGATFVVTLPIKQGLS